MLFETRGPRENADDNEVDLNTSFAAAAVEIDDGGEIGTVKITRW